MWRYAHWLKNAKLHHTIPIRVRHHNEQQTQQTPRVTWVGKEASTYKCKMVQNIKRQGCYHCVEEYGGSYKLHPELPYVSASCFLLSEQPRELTYKRNMLLTHKPVSPDRRSDGHVALDLWGAVFHVWGANCSPQSQEAKVKRKRQESQRPKELPPSRLSPKGPIASRVVWKRNASLPQPWGFEHSNAVWGSLGGVVLL